MIKGSGWIKDGAYGCENKCLKWRYADIRSLYTKLLKDKILTYPIENFGRFNPESKLVAISVALALHDANIRYSKNKKQDIGIIGSNPDAALAANLDYFKDYVSCGRKLGRGNIFIYTLPSSALAESAIHFGLQGPLLYIRHTKNPQDNLLSQAELMVHSNEAKALLAVSFNSSKATCFFVTKHYGQK